MSLIKKEDKAELGSGGEGARWFGEKSGGGVTGKVNDVSFAPSGCF